MSTPPTQIIPDYAQNFWNQPKGVKVGVFVIYGLVFGVMVKSSLVSLLFKIGVVS